MSIKTFYDIPEITQIGETDHFFLMYDGFPVSPGHILIISKVVLEDYFSLSVAEAADMNNAILLAKSIIEKDHEPNGYNIGMNCGETAGQTVFHFHCHVIPRYNGDMENPRGGVRHCVEGKGNY